MLGTCMHGVVYGKLNHAEDIVPLFLELRSVCSKDLFYSFIHPLCLTIRLRVPCRRGTLMNTQVFTDLCKEVTCKTWISVMNNIKWKTMLAKDMILHELSKSLCRQIDICLY